MRRSFGWIGLSLMLALPLAAQGDAGLHKRLQARLEAMTREPAVARAHWGVSVEEMDGSPVVRINAGQFFQPASNAKLFTTAAAMALLPMDERLTTPVVASGEFGAGGVFTGSLRIVGVGDANLSGRPVPYSAPVAGHAEAPRDELRYVNEWADQIKAAGITRVAGDVVGDDSFFPWEPYPSDWAIDDTPWYYGAPVSGLMVADASVTLTVSVGVSKGTESREQGTAMAGSPMPVPNFDPALPYYTVDMQAVVGPAGSGTSLEIQRTAGSKLVHVYGTIAADAKPYVQGMSIDDPAEYAAMALKAALEARGVAVSGAATAKHVPGSEPSFMKTVMEPLHPLRPADTPRRRSADADFPPCADSFNKPVTANQSQADQNHADRHQAGQASALPGRSCIAARHTGQPRYDDVVITNKVSQNQHAELLLRQLGFYITGQATTAQGARVVRSFLTKAGIDPEDFVFYDGSGLSGHDLVTPRSATRLLRYATGQPWGERWKASLPVGGVDGSLRNRFSGPLAGKVFAKTGTLGEARALSGYLICSSGRTVAFSVMVSTHSPRVADDEVVMDRMLAAIAEAE